MIRINTNNGVLMLVVANILTINVNHQSVLINFTTGFTLELGLVKQHCGRDFQFNELTDNQFNELLITLDNL